MLIIKLEKESNGTHASHRSNTLKIPEGWGVVSPEIEECAISLLPWVNIVVIDGVITTMTENTVAKELWENTLQTPQPTADDIMQSRISDLEMAIAALMGGAL